LRSQTIFQFEGVGHCLIPVGNNVYHLDDSNRLCRCYSNSVYLFLPQSRRGII
jgi:hypothetical protein